MLAQYIIIGILFIAAVAFFCWRAYRSLSKKSVGCDKGCGCSEHS